MKIAVLSDIHGNLGALDAVLNDIAQRDVDLIVNLGDILSGALQPVETANRLMALDLPTIRGNHERQVLTGDPTRMGPSDKMAHSLLQPKHTYWLGGLPESLCLFNDVLMVHGTPDSDLSYLLEMVTASGCRSATKHEVAQRLTHIDASLILCGHTHIPRSVKLDDGRLIVNPGSVGLQAYEDEHPYLHRMETGSPHARYAIVERSAIGWSSQLWAIEYDWDAAAELAAQNDRIDWVRPLKTGYVR